ncbi:hypothetical protein M422DRAFT_237633 [Sphaerobolus stellatus SS14]|uniref:Diacetyl reductase [(S)-acetoin forming] n=1 Tax=Sphaerobolus stellatus (strain SS14) TaxID=990650 RepID=A0A0C9U432_SPHS4|nr:hypothetical protein M422DRAFT_237633 [Sphaerobolus stellatus SS14]
MASNVPSIVPKAVIVTGAAQGIGRAIALRLARDGYDIALNDLPYQSAALEILVQEIKSNGNNAISIVADISKEDEVQRMVERTVDELGDLWAMVANAGITGGSKPIIEMPLETWQKLMDVNLTGTFLCYKAAAKQLLAQEKGGRIIGASSMHGKRGHARAGAYCVTKFGIRALTQSLASELGPHGITVNAYAPGVIDTPLLEAALHSGSIPENPEERAEDIQQRKMAVAVRFGTVLPRVGQPEDVAGVVSYLISRESDFMTGQSVSINGGTFYD